MVATIGTVLGLVVAAFFLIVCVNLTTLALMRGGLLPRSDAWEGVILLLVGAVGGVGLWAGLGGSFGTGIPPLSADFKASVILLYVTSCLIYVEIKSLLSRGFSLRILVDLLDAGGQASVEKLKSDYGGGIGVRGLIMKRLRTLADLGLLQLGGDEAGPLSPLGRAAALVSHRLRQWLRLDLVG